MALGGRELEVAQRGGQVVSTTQTPGPSQTRQVKRLTQAKDVGPVCARVYISLSVYVWSFL